MFYIIQLLHPTAMPVIKASFMLFLRRIFGHMRAFRLTFWIVGAYVFLWWLTTFWMTVFQCWPISLNFGEGNLNFTEGFEGCIPNFWVRNENVPVAFKAWLTLQDMVRLGSFIERCERCGHHNNTNPFRLASSNVIAAKTRSSFSPYYCDNVCL